MPVPFWIHRLYTFGKVEATVHDTAVSVWLAPNSNSEKAIAALAESAVVTEIFELRHEGEQWKYRPVFHRSHHGSNQESRWADVHNEELVNSMVAENSPTLVALLEDEVGFDLLGDHGGAQEQVQRIPLLVAQSPFRGQVSLETVRLVNLQGLISAAMGLPSH